MYKLMISVQNYDICINSDALGVERASEIICDIVNNKVTVS